MVTDNGSPARSDMATITVNITDVNDAPILEDTTLSLDENSSNGAVVGTATATDEDTPAQGLTYAITTGNDSGAFAIDPSTGQITVADSSLLDHESVDQYVVTVQVTDDGTPTPTNTPGGPTATMTAVVTPTLSNTPGGPTFTPTMTGIGPADTPTPSETPGGPTRTPTLCETASFDEDYDLNSDGIINAIDLLLLIDDVYNGNIAHDLNCDGQTNDLDIVEFSERWGIDIP